MSSSIETYTRLKELADRQAGYFTAGQASDLGYASSQRIFHSGKGNWSKICRNLYRLPGYKDSPESEFIKFSLLSIGRLDTPKAVISHESALYHYGLLDKAPAVTCLTVPHDFRTKVPAGCRLYRKNIGEDETINAGAFRVTSISRTLNDASSIYPEDEMGKLALRAFERKLIAHEALKSYGIPIPAEADRGLSKQDRSFQHISVKENRFAILAVRSEGHFYEDLYRQLVSNLQKKGIFSIMTHIDDNAETMKHEIDEVMYLKPVSIITEGLSASHMIDYLESKSDSFGSAIFILQKPRNASGAFRAHCVLTDHWYGSYMATKHLIGLGHEKIMLIDHEWEYAAEEFRGSVEYSFEEGYRMALKEAGLLDFEQYFYDSRDITLLNAKFLKLLKSKDRPTAIISSGDYRITSKLDSFRKAGIRIPEDMSVIGHYNTPWSTATDLQLTSVSIREDLIASKVAEIVSGENKSSEIIVRPELIERTSCGPIKKAISDKVAVVSRQAFVPVSSFKQAGQSA